MCRTMTDSTNTADAVYDQLLRTLAPLRQEHLLQFWTELSSAQRDRLQSQIWQIDFHQIAELVRGGHGGDDWAALARRAEPHSAVRLDGTGSDVSSGEAIAAGQRALKNGEVGAILVAGGQGTRL